MYKIFYTTTGQPGMITRESDGAALPFYPETRTFDESDPLVVELREWESTSGALDLSDKLPDIDLVNAKLQAIASINSIARDRQVETLDKYFPAERDIWYAKFQEATQFLSLSILQLNDSNTPKYLRQETIASGKQATLSAMRSLAQEIQSKADAYRLAAAFISGKQTKKRLEIEALTTIQQAIAYPIYEGWD